LPAWADITLPVPVTLKRFLAPDFVFSLGIWLSYGHRKTRPKGAFAAKMLVRALKVLGYFRNEIARTGIDTAALDQPGDEGALMAERNEIGNAEPWNRIPRQIANRRWRRVPKTREK
jgi:hypothetical protein